MHSGRERKKLDLPDQSEDLSVEKSGPLVQPGRWEEPGLLVL